MLFMLYCVSSWGLDNSPSRYRSRNLVRSDNGGSCLFLLGEGAKHFNGIVIILDGPGEALHLFVTNGLILFSNKQHRTKTCKTYPR